MALLDASNPVVTIQVGEKYFTTTRDTLISESGFFASSFSSDPSRFQNKDDCLFIDADPDAFQHVLRYLRHRIFPIFYDNDKGHDDNMYLAVLQVAKGLKIWRLEKWIETKEYIKAVKISWRVTEGEGTFTASSDSSVCTDELHVDWIARKTENQVCLRGIQQHLDNPELCGVKCLKAFKEAGNCEHKVMVWTRVQKKVVIDDRLRVRAS